MLQFVPNCLILISSDLHSYWVFIIPILRYPTKTNVSYNKAFTRNLIFASAHFRGRAKLSAEPRKHKRQFEEVFEGKDMDKELEEIIKYNLFSNLQSKKAVKREMEFDKNLQNFQF